MQFLHNPGLTFNQESPLVYPSFQKLGISVVYTAESCMSWSEWLCFWRSDQPWAAPGRFLLFLEGEFHVC